MTLLLKSQDLDQEDVSSFRPIAALPTTSKIVEKVAQQQIQNYLEETNQLNLSNHAYRKQLSTTTTLIEVMDEVYLNTEENKISQMMTIYQLAAFDSVNHDILIQKLARYGMSQPVLNWCQDYLSWRTQYVQIGRASSSMIKIDRGVPQGSVAGPLMYAIYTNELTETVKKPSCREPEHQDRKTLFGPQCRTCGIISLYADDCTYIVGSKTREQNKIRLLRNLDEIQLYLHDNQLAINCGKTSLTELMIKQKRGRIVGTPPNLNVQDKPGTYKTIENSPYSRVLGANLQGNLSWYTHLESGKKALLPIVRKQIGRLKLLGKMIPAKSRANLARGMIQSRLNYLLPLWGGAADTHLKKAQTVLNTAVRWVTGLPKKTRITRLMDKIGWFSIKEQTKIATLVQTWNLIHKNKPGRLLQNMTIEEDLSIGLQRPRLQFTIDCFKWRATREWNALPQETRMEMSVACFKRKVKRQVIEERTRPPDPGA